MLDGAANALTTLLGAFLLFVVQPMLGKLLLPVFGGTPATWAACMVFFQGMLLAGYAYAHLGVRAPLRVQAGLHLGLVGAAVLLLVLQPSAAVVAGRGWPPFEIAWLLAREIGAPYFVLACTAPLVQRWAALAQGREPYRLYALSNAGSLAALLVYPWLIEPGLALDAQRSLFTRAFGLFALLLGAVCVRTLTRAGAGTAAPALPLSAAPTSRQRLRWLGLAFLPSVLLLAVTNHITVDIAATPLLWIVPLAIYLVTFILAFAGGGAARRSWLLVLLALAGTLLGFGAFAQGSASLPRQLGAPLLLLFAGALLCHDALVASRPAPDRLTAFYLEVALGGVLGGVAVSWIAPLVFDDYYELELGVLALYALLLGMSAGFSRVQRQALLLGVGVVAPLLAAALIVRVGGETRQGVIVERMRSFLGPLRVTQLPEGRVLTHGRIRHGMQLSAAGMHDRPTMYFGPGTALALVMQRQHAEAPRQIAIVGLGVGTIAAYGKRGDRLRFYELDANVVELARRDFTFLRDTAARVEVVLGDGRLSLAAEPAQGFDVLALDAFSSDSVPVHLLTQRSVRRVRAPPRARRRAAGQRVQPAPRGGACGAGQRSRARPALRHRGDARRSAAVRVARALGSDDARPAAARALAARRASLCSTRARRAMDWMPARACGRFGAEGRELSFQQPGGTLARSTLRSSRFTVGTSVSTMSSFEMAASAPESVAALTSSESETPEIITTPSCWMRRFLRSSSISALPRSSGISRSTTATFTLRCMMMRLAPSGELAAITIKPARSNSRLMLVRATSLSSITRTCALGSIDSLCTSHLRAQCRHKARVRAALDAWPKRLG